MGAIVANVTFSVLQAPHSKHHYSMLGQGWQQTYKIGLVDARAALIFH